MIECVFCFLYVVSAVVQLQGMASKRQCKEAAAQLEVPFLVKQSMVFVGTFMLVVVHLL